MVLTETVISYVIVIVFSYFFGSFSTSIVVARILQGMDIRKVGSGNAGTTNVLRSLGKRAALWVLTGDVLKTVAAFFLGRLLLGDIGGWIGGLCCVIGHIFPAYFQFKGGKGVLSAGTLLACADIRVFTVCIGIFIITMLVKRTVSISSLSAAVAALICVWAFPMPDYEKIVLAAVVLVVIYKHKDNIERLLHGTEPVTSFKKKV